MKEGRMSRKRFTAEQIIGLLREADVKLFQGRGVGQVSREMGITEQTYYRWRKEYGGMKTAQVKRLKDLELWEALGRPDLADQSSYDEMDANNQLLKEELTRIFLTRTAAEWEEFFDQAHVPAARVNTIPEALALKQLNNRENLFHTFNTVPGTEQTVTVPVAGFSYAHGGPSVEMPPSRMGTHTEEVLRELGYDVEYIAVLRREGVI